MAGSLRLKYPSNVRIVKLPCTGRVDAKLILDAIEGGADGVAVVGCLEGDCHFLKGNIKARQQVNHVKKILESISIDPERVEMFNLSASDGPLFAEYVKKFTQTIKGLGPLYNTDMNGNAEKLTAQG